MPMPIKIITIVFNLVTLATYSFVLLTFGLLNMIQKDHNDCTHYRR